MQPETFDLKISAFSFNDVVGRSISFHSGWARQSPNVRKACNFKAFESLPGGIACWLTFQQQAHKHLTKGRGVGLGGIFSLNKSARCCEIPFLSVFYSLRTNVSATQKKLFRRHHHNRESPWSSFIRYNPNQPARASTPSTSYHICFIITSPLWSSNLFSSFTQAFILGLFFSVRHSLSRFFPIFGIVLSAL